MQAPAAALFSNQPPKKAVLHLRTNNEPGGTQPANVPPPPPIQQILSSSADVRKVRADREAVADQRASIVERRHLPAEERVPPSQQALRQANQGRGPAAAAAAADTLAAGKKPNLRRQIEADFDNSMFTRQHALQTPVAAPPPPTAAAAAAAKKVPPLQTARPLTAGGPAGGGGGDGTGTAKVAQAAEKNMVENGVGVVDDAAQVLHDSLLWTIAEVVKPIVMVMDVQRRCDFVLFACQEADWAWPTEQRARPLGPALLKSDWPKIPLESEVTSAITGAAGVSVKHWPSAGYSIEYKHLRVVLLQGDKTGGHPGHPQGIPVVIHKPTGAAYMLWSHAATYVGVDILTLRNMAKMAFHNSSAILSCPQVIQVEGTDAETIIQRAMEATRRVMGEGAPPEGLNCRSAYTKQRSVCGVPLLVAALRALRAVKQSCTVKMRDGALAQ